MSKLTELYNEIIETQRHCQSGVVTKDAADRDLRFYKVRASVLNQQTAIGIHGYPDGGKPFLKHMDRTGITSPGETIPLLPAKIEYERVICENGRGEITRTECLDAEGKKETENEECKGCEIGIINKKRLCPPQQEHV